MHVIEPHKDKDGFWTMTVRTMSPSSGPFSICQRKEKIGEGESEVGALVPCMITVGEVVHHGHLTALNARNCLHAKAWAKKIQAEGELVIEGLKPQLKAAEG